MKNCIECGYKFTIVDRLKIYLNLKGNLTCPQCKSVYRDNFNIYRGSIIKKGLNLKKLNI